MNNQTNKLLRLALRFEKKLISLAQKISNQDTLKLQKLITKFMMQNQLNDSYNQQLGINWQSPKDEDGVWGERTDKISKAIIRNFSRWIESPQNIQNIQNIPELIKVLENVTKVDPTKTNELLESINKKYNTMYENLKNRTKNFSTKIVDTDWWDDDKSFKLRTGTEWNQLILMMNTNLLKDDQKLKFINITNEWSKLVNLAYVPLKKP